MFMPSSRNVWSEACKAVAFSGIDGFFAIGCLKGKKRLNATVRWIRERVVGSRSKIDGRKKFELGYLTPRPPLQIGEGEALRVKHINKVVVNKKSPRYAQGFQKSIQKFNLQ
jgi:hypothetical protein